MSNATISLNLRKYKCYELCSHQFNYIIGVIQSLDITTKNFQENSLKIKFERFPMTNRGHVSVRTSTMNHRTFRHPNEKPNAHFPRLHIGHEIA